MECEILRQEITQMLRVVQDNIETCSFDVPISTNDFYAIYLNEAIQVISSLNDNKKKHLELLSTIKKR